MSQQEFDRGVNRALDYAVRGCETLVEGLRRLSRYPRFLHEVAETRLRVDRERTILSHPPCPGGGAASAFGVCICRLATHFAAKAQGESEGKEQRADR